MAALVVLSGLPGTGKSTVAGQVVDVTGADLLAKDVIEAALWRRGVGRDQDSSWVAHEVMTSLASEALRRGRTVVLDTVAGTERVRRDWRVAAAAVGAAFVVVVCSCRDVELHRRRLLGRRRGIDGWPELTWADAEATRGRWEAWNDPHLEIDAADDLHANATAVIDYLRAATARTPRGVSRT
ncbi:MAG: AAA family ATPase [Ilumatobacteraceae bacterium]